jgi:hypothetical protein
MLGVLHEAFDATVHPLSCRTNVATDVVVGHQLVSEFV